MGWLGLNLKIHEQNPTEIVHKLFDAKGKKSKRN